MYEIYKIKDNDNLSNILKEYNTTKEELIKLNGDDILYNNNEIIVPKKKDKNYEYYTVKKEDTIYKIAEDNKIDYNILLKINGLDKDDYIYPNQTILLPRNGNNMYITKENDTIKNIIKELNTDINRLQEINDNIYLEKEQIIYF